MIEILKDREKRVFQKGAEKEDRSQSAFPLRINILGDFNLAGETWIIKEYYRRMGIRVVSCITGDGRVDEIKQAHCATLNVVQCSGSMTQLAKMMEETYDIPFQRVSYFGIEDMAEALYTVARHFKDLEVLRKTEELVRTEVNRIYPEVQCFRRALEDKKAAIYVGGSFKAFSLVKALHHLGIRTAIVGPRPAIQRIMSI
jgi:nitrogenase molybdenum-cofactor synthesis protein NifE